MLPKTFFQRELKKWYDHHKRDLPWRKTNDPYLIWLSEIMLQQTRVAQGLPYYHKFTERFSTISELALAEDDEVMKLWEGLGYYSRARNMLHAARFVHHKREGVFPHTYQEIRELKGVGDYTAAAIASMAFGEAYAVVDGNVYRLLSRFLGIDTPVNSSAGKKEFAQAADEMLDCEDPATYNQAVMEFGALQCIPRKPDCGHCVLRSGCEAYKTGRVEELPVKLRKKYDRKRYFHYLMIASQDHVLVERREGSDIWKHLFQFPLIETQRPLEMEALLAEVGLPDGFEVREYTSLAPHKLSHQTIYIHVLKLNMASADGLAWKGGGQWVPKSDLETLAFPRPLRQFLDQNQLNLPFGPRA
ncbi:MAG TPA: A/G-specific adenine glycosylase [Cryomorphaceae bacterium]|nr:A/G-specific adenine glycosylase [Owenweeksia sp.]MBF97458.1 A/G-specific adenine glycosylase [Owenweeksia sp.]HAD96020.1 A/G-specific adenine glycosylase [Cryomorphaceae bacterium]HBF20409.1 A/G-specific adenine glycosylase [Cryomorphaceae bacterium]